MKALHFFRADLLKVIVSIVCIQLMVICTIPGYTIAAPKKDTTMAVRSSADLDRIIIPHEVGKVDETYEGLEETLIVHIQDVHCNYEGQKNIAEILKILADKNDVTLFGLEGAKGHFMADKFHVLKNTEVRRKIADYFMKTGKITGSEYFAISYDMPVTLYGIENEDSYMEHFHSFAEPWKFNDEFMRYYEQVNDVAEQIKSIIYPAELRELDTKEQESDEGKLNLVDFCNYLKDILIAQNTNLREYKNFARLVTLNHLEKGINFDNVNKEQVDLLNFLGPRLDEAEIMDIRQVAIDFKNGRMSSNDYYAYLKNLCYSKEIDLARFPNIAFYFKYLEMYGQLDFTGLIDEKVALIKILKEKLIVTDDQRAIDNISTSLNIIKKLFALRVSNQEFQRFLKFKATFTSKYVASSLSDIGSRNGVIADIQAHFPFEDKFQFMEEFYHLAEVRNEALFENTLSFMKDEDSNTAVLISGGFHTQGMLEMMRSKDIGYAVIAPTITQEHDYNLYINNMLGEDDRIDELFGLQLPGTSLIPPPLVTAVDPFIPQRRQQMIQSTVLYGIALEAASLIDRNIDLTDKEYLLPEDQQKVLNLLGGNQYLNDISTTLGVPNLNIDLQNIRVEGANNGIIVIPVTLFDLHFKAVVIHPDYDLVKTPSRLIEELRLSEPAEKDVPDLNLKIFFDGTRIPDKELLKQDIYLQNLIDRIPAIGAPVIVPNLLSAIAETVEGDFSVERMGPKIVADTEGDPIGRIENYDEKGKGDSLIIYNVNGDEIVGLAESLSNPSFQQFPAIPNLDLSLYTMIPYSTDLNSKTAFPKVHAETSIGKALSDAGVSQSRIVGRNRLKAMTDALDGNSVISYVPETYALIEVETPPVDTIGDKPAYNSKEIADRTIERIRETNDRVVMTNFSAADIAGQTGSMVLAAETLDQMDQEIRRTIEAARQSGMTVVLSGTYGNIEQMLDDKDIPVRGRYNSHTANPVPFVYIDDRDQRLATELDIMQEGLTLGAVAPTILEILGIEKPDRMTSSSVFKDFQPLRNDRLLFITIDGIGSTPNVRGNAIDLARQKLQRENRRLYLDQLFVDQPATDLLAEGENVGLRKDKPGYADANYFAIGTGLAAEDIKLEMVLIDESIQNETFKQNQVFNEAIDRALRNNTKLHLLGLVSDAEVDASIQHLEALLNLAKERGMQKNDVIIHTITDGIDEAPLSATDNIKKVMKLTEEIGVGTLATIGGRYWFMNQEMENDKIEKAYNALVNQKFTQEISDVTGAVLLPEEMIDNSLGLNEAISVIHQQYGQKVKIGVLTTRPETAMQRILRVNNVADKIDFIVPESLVKEQVIADRGLIDPIVNYITGKYPSITNPAKQIAIITMDIDKLGPDAVRKAQIFVQERPKSENEVLSAANGLFVAVMTIDGHENEIMAYDGYVEGQVRTLKTIVVERNFLEQLNRQREINRMFETAA
ncbi:MAG: hypothetical protein RBU23_08975 [Candidatus Auribacterota bacterium]|nr:hypothetical protein [Candidatus Auribacterota bacterium]